MTKTVEEWLNEWLEVYVKTNLAEKTYRCYNDSIKRIIREDPDFISQFLNEVNEIEIQKFVNSLGLKYSKSTLNDIRVVLNQSYKAAVQNSFCPRNPISHISIPKNASQKFIRAFTQKEQIIVEKSAIHDPLGHIVFFFLYTGLRSNELCSLKWSDYDSEKDIIRIRKSKTKAGIRSVPLIPEAKAIIESCPHYSNFIFTSTRKGPVTESVLKKLYMRLRNETGITFITNHVYRHSFATRLVEKGVDYKALSKLLGHTDVAFTLRQYTDTEDKFLRQQILLLHQGLSQNIS
jgi:integrase